MDPEKAPLVEETENKPDYNALIVNEGQQGAAPSAKPQNLPQNSPTGLYTCSLLWFLGWGLALWLVLGGVTETECANPAWYWVNFAKYYYTAGFILVLLALLGLASPQTGEGGIMSCLKCLISLGNLALAVCSVALSVGFIIAWAHRDQCGGLSGILWPQFIFACLTFASMAGCCCVGLCSCCCAASISLGALMSHVNTFVPIPIPGVAPQQTGNSAGNSGAAATATDGKNQQGDYAPV